MSDPKVSLPVYSSVFSNSHTKRIETQSNSASILTENMNMTLTSFVSEENRPLQTYPRRFWILGVFSVLAWFQCVQWNLWGPLSESVEAAFAGWGSGTVAMMANWGTITFVFLTIPMVWFLIKKGLRWGVLTITSITFVSTIMRTLPFFTSSDTFFTVMCHLAAIINGLVGPLIMTSPPLIASVWFPPRERTTATAFGQLFNQLGNAGSYLQPLIVRSPEDADREDIRSDIARLMYIYAGMAGLFFSVTLIYFPAKPPTPPSISSSEERFDFKDSAKKLIKNSQFLWIVFSSVVSTSVPAMWLTVLNFSLKELGIDQDEAVWIGFLAVVVSVVSGLVISRLTDIIYGHIRVTIMCMMVGDLALFYWFFLLTWGSITVTKWQVYVCVIAGFSLNLSTMPLFTELAMECVYPCSEQVVAGFLSFGMCAVGIIFLSVFLIPNIGYDWVTYVLLGTNCLSLIPLSFVRENYNRTNVDKGKQDRHGDDDALLF